MRSKWFVFITLAVILACLGAILLYNIPPVHEQLSWRVASLRTQIERAINPPEQVVFVPEGEISTVQADKFVLAQEPEFTATAVLPSPVFTPENSDVTATVLPSPTATQSPTPIPAFVQLSGVVHEYQQMNNCGPATLSMNLSYWGWEGDQRDTRAALRPNFQQVDDKNVNPSEMEAFVEANTGLEAVARVGGDIGLLKKFIAAGFPVMIQLGT